jgi:beta-1,4-mannosyltransferase
MKVVDMFSAQLPCLAIGGYASLPELVIDGHNGRVFNTSEQLANQINEVLNDKSKLEHFRKNLS